MNLLFYDDKCPFCIKTIRFLKKYVKPKYLKYVSLSSSDLNSNIYERAMKEMLLITTEKKYLWGYDTYIKLFRISNSKFRIINKLISFFMSLSIVKTLGRFIYAYISKRRKRCDESCDIR